MDYSVIQEMFQKMREENDDEYWLFMSGEIPEDLPSGNEESNLVKPTDSESQDDDDLLF